LEVINLAERKRKELAIKEIGTRITLLGVRYSDNEKLILEMAKAIKDKARPIRDSPEKPKTFIIEPLSAYDYG
jgi:hypothetical protein